MNPFACRIEITLSRWGQIRVSCWLPAVDGPFVSEWNWRECEDIAAYLLDGTERTRPSVCRMKAFVDECVSRGLRQFRKMNPRP